MPMMNALLMGLICSRHVCLYLVLDDVSFCPYVQHIQELGMDLRVMIERCLYIYTANLTFIPKRSLAPQRVKPAQRPTDDS